MSIENVNGKDIESKLHNIFMNHDTTRSGKMETLNEISELGKELLADLNTMDSNIYEISEDCDNAFEEAVKKKQEVEDAKDEQDEYYMEILKIDEEIAAFEDRLNNGEELSESEQKRLDDLYTKRGNLQYNADSMNSKLSNLNYDMSSAMGKVGNYNNLLNGIISKMPGYKEAGEKIKDSANEYGKKNMNCEKAMERNETSWWNFFSVKGGVHAEVGAVVGAGAGYIGGAAAGAAIGAACGTVFPGLGNIIGAAIGCVAGLILGAVGGGFGGAAIGSNSKTQMEKYTEQAGLTEVADQTFYDEETHEFITEYDALEAKGGNQIQGKLRKATAKVYSVGKTISSSSDVVKNKAEDQKKDLN